MSALATVCAATAARRHFSSALRLALTTVSMPMSSTLILPPAKTRRRLTVGAGDGRPTTLPHAVSLGLASASTRSRWAFRFCVGSALAREGAAVKTTTAAAAAANDARFESMRMAAA